MQLLCEKIYINLRFECKNRETFVNNGVSIFGLKNDTHLVRLPVFLLPLHNNWGRDGHIIMITPFDFNFIIKTVEKSDRIY